MVQSLLNSFRGTLLGPSIASKLIHQKKTQLHWETVNQKIIIDLIQNETISEETSRVIISPNKSLIPGEIILKILPLILFFYETENLLCEQLKRIEKNSVNFNQKIIEEVILFRKIINLIIQRKNPLLENICKVSELTQNIHEILNRRTPLTEIKKQFQHKNVLESNYLLLSLYCFSRTPNNFKLSILQAKQFRDPVILGVTATISGAYNGYSGIPISWRLSMGLNQENNLKDEYITQLWAKWVGVDNPSANICPLETQVIKPVKGGNF
ncbi:ADP-ribosylglycohydrolase family protein [Crocosphaera sp. Alani8]|uniref:ADP-ribosylglycohydrolase family protein n=1 Tax=Crocosphaera sp. Alani8 TaxID=3038952 RepID=UPI00313CCEF3